MTEASVTKMGQAATREIKVADQTRTVVLNADLKLKLQDVSRAAAESKIGAVEAQRQICAAIYGRTFWESIPFEMAEAFSEPASQIYFDMFNIEIPSKGGDEEADASDDDNPSGPEAKNEEPPQNGG